MLRYQCQAALYMIIRFSSSFLSAQLNSLMNLTADSTNKGGARAGAQLTRLRARLDNASAEESIESPHPYLNETHKSIILLETRLLMQERAS